MPYKKLYTTPEYTPIEISTDAGMTSVLVAANENKVIKFTGTTGTYTNGDLYVVEKLNLLPVGGRIFYDNGDNGATYTFYDSSYNKITDISISGLTNAVYYAVSGTQSADRWYVFDNSTHTVSDGTTTYSATSGLVSSIMWGYYMIDTGATTNTIGSGKVNTSTVLAIEDTSSYNTNTIWKYIKALNDNTYNNCNDWFIGSEAEQDQLRDVASTVGISWYSSSHPWSSVDAYPASWCWWNNWLDYDRYGKCSGFAMRAF